MTHNHYRLLASILAFLLLLQTQIQILPVSVRAENAEDYPEVSPYEQEYEETVDDPEVPDNPPEPDININTDEELDTLPVEPDADVVIHNAEELQEFSKNCSLDTWSQGLTVALANDIDLSGLDFTPIPTFGGEFDGGAFTISGLRISSGGSRQGLFREIQEGAVVQNLKVSGTVSVSGDSSVLGGIAGENAGTILNCSFSGTVSGKREIGGIVGVNRPAGSLFGCTSTGLISGERRTGGIVGQNTGSVSECINHSAVNPMAPDMNQSFTGELDALGNFGDVANPINSIDTLQSTESAILDVCMDTGGIAGSSTGILRGCHNEGNIGYPYTGYNVGGIVGCSSGYMETCENYGTVYGRKDVGGIAGQLTPDIRMIFTPDALDELQTELDRLHELTNTAINHMDDTRESIGNRLSNISNTAQGASDDVSALTYMIKHWSDDTIAQINDLADTLASTFSRLNSATAPGDNIINTLSSGIDELENAIQEIAAVADSGEDALSDLDDAIRTLRNGLDDARWELEQLRLSFEGVADSLVLKNETRTGLAISSMLRDLEDFSDALKDCRSALQDILSLLRLHFPENFELSLELIANRQESTGITIGRDENGRLDVDKQQDTTGGVYASSSLDELLKRAREKNKLLQQYLSLFEQRLDAAASSLDRAGNSLDSLVNGFSNDNSVKTAAQNARDALRSFLDKNTSLDASLSALQSSIAGFNSTVSGLGLGISNLTGVTNTFEKAAQETRTMIQNVHDLFSDLSQRQPLTVNLLDGNFYQTEDSLHGALTDISDEIYYLHLDMDYDGDVFSTDVRAVSDQLSVVMGVIGSVLAGRKEESEFPLWNDVSEDITEIEEVDSVVLGKIRDCTNDGDIDGDINIGGIAGSMAIERETDPEDELITQVGSRSLDFHYETRAILQSCNNTGRIRSRKDSAGGITGLMNLGYIWQCENTGLVETTAGNYTGGIAGQAYSVIRSCQSQCVLSGGNYVGGIAGYATEVYTSDSLVAVREAGSYVGAIVGDWERDKGTLSQNRFVSDTLAAADGISYMGQAEPVPYAILSAAYASSDGASATDEFVDTGGIVFLNPEGANPGIFQQMNITYLVDGQVWSRVYCNYGEPLPTWKAPAVPEKEGYSGAWESPGEDVITTDHYLNAVYTPYRTSLASDAERSANQPVFLVEGRFLDTATLTAELTDKPSGDMIPGNSDSTENPDDTGDIINNIPNLTIPSYVQEGLQNFGSASISDNATEPADTDDNTPEDVPADTPENTDDMENIEENAENTDDAENTENTENGLDDTQYSSLESLQYAAPENMQDGMFILDETQDETPVNVSEDMTDHDDLLGDTPDETPEDTTDYDDLSEDTPDETSGDDTEDMTDNAPENMSDDTSDGILDDIDDLFDGLLDNDTPDNTPGSVSGGRQNQKQEFWKVVLTGAADEGPYVFHFRLPDGWKNASLYQEDGTLIPSHAEGSYLIFTTDRTEFVLEARRQEMDISTFAWGITIGLGVLVLFLIVKLMGALGQPRTRRKTPGKPRKKTIKKVRRKLPEKTE